MISFKEWLRLGEMCGTGVVSPKPGVDYQIWGNPASAARLAAEARKSGKKKK
jgi:NADPH:quinone reductase-like Zn-dependent oxidoreductase